MAHSYRSLYVHVIFHVKCCPVIPQDVPVLHAYMRSVMSDIGCQSIVVGGMEDHVHLMAEFPADGVGKTIGKVKSAATRWLKRRNPEVYHSFSWQTGSGQFSVSYSITEKVRRYIERQREHHQTMTAKENSYASSNNIISLARMRTIYPFTLDPPARRSRRGIQAGHARLQA